MPLRIGVMCYICGREFGSASITIHLPQCEKKWNIEQQKLPKKQRRPPPTKPFEYDTVIGGNLKGKDLQEAMEKLNAQALDDFNKKSLLECKNCGRTFLPRPLEIHQRSCKPGQERPVRKPRSPTKVGLPQIKKSIPTPPPPPPLQPSQASLSPERNNNDRYQVRPGTYKKSASTPCDEMTDGGEDPTRGDIMEMIEKDVAFSSLENRKLLMGFIKKICQAPV